MLELELIHILLAVWFRHIDCLLCRKGGRVGGLLASSICVLFIAVCPDWVSHAKWGLFWDRHAVHWLWSRGHHLGILHPRV